MSANVTPLQLKRLQIENFRCFDLVELPFAERGLARKRTIFIGNNGHGKTSLLRALAIGLCPFKEATGLIDKLPGQVIRVSKKRKPNDSARIRIELFDPVAPDQTYTITTTVYLQYGQEYLEKETEPRDFPWQRLFVCGYGANRGSERYTAASRYSLSGSLMSLFTEEPALQDPESVLKDFKIATDAHQSKLWSHVQNTLRTLLRQNNLKLELTEKGEARVVGPWGSMPFHALGDGYRGTATWMLDLLGRAFQQDTGLTKRGPAGGILLIDEVDEHLHPSWQRDILEALAKTLPNMQIVATTHSALTIVNCPSGEIGICGLKNTVASLDFPLPAMEGYTTDQILKGVWFGLEETLDRGTEAQLRAYQNALRGGDPERVAEARSKVRDYLGFAPLTLMDELAVAIATKYRSQFDSTPVAKRAELIDAAVTEMRAKLRSLP